jgi:hypothetical protein
MTEKTEHNESEWCSVCHAQAPTLESAADILQNHIDISAQVAGPTATVSAVSHSLTYDEAWVLMSAVICYRGVTP